MQEHKEKEAYLIIMVHGIGSNTETQAKNRQDFINSVDKLITGGYIKADYTFEMVMIDWKSTVDSSEIRQRMKKCQV